MKYKLFSLFFLVWMTTQVFAGWIVTMDENGKQTKMYVDGSKVLIQEEANQTSIVDLATGDITMIDKSKKTYWTGNLMEMKEAVTETVEKSQKMIEQQLKNLPPEQREAMKKMMGNMMPQKAKKVVPTIKKAGMEKIAGKMCSKYQVFVNGILKEELWLTTDVPFLAEMKKAGNISKWYEMEGEFEKMGGGMSYKSNKKYLDLVKMQFPMKSREKISENPMGGSEGNWHVSTVISYKKANVSGMFKIPAGYTKKSIKQLYQEETGAGNMGQTGW